jgi:hypothetical protein
MFLTKSDKNGMIILPPVIDGLWEACYDATIIARPFILEGVIDER